MLFILVLSFSYIQLIVLAKFNLSNKGKKDITKNPKLEGL